MTRKFGLVLVAAVLCVTGCAAIRKNMPSAKFDVCAFGACVSIDTRKATDLAVDAGESVAEAAGVKAPPAPAVPVPAVAEPVK